MKRIVVIGTSLGIVLTIIAAGASVALSQLWSSRVTSGSTQQQVVVPAASEILKIVNDERGKSGARLLTVSDKLNQSAQRKADDMAKYNYLDHISPNDNKHGYEYIGDTGTSCKSNSENLAWDWGENTHARPLVDRWMNSPAHKSAMLDPKYNSTGFGVSVMPDKKTVVVVEHFCE